MSRLRAHLIRILAFSRKEIAEVLRQPKLVMTSVIGPFLILGLFALGYEPRPDPLKTLLVLPEGSELADRAAELEESLESFITIVGVTQDKDEATRRLLDGEVDVVVAAPADAAATIRGGEHAIIDVLHTKLDPFDRARISIFSRSSIDQLNRELLQEVARVGQERVEQHDDALPAARASAGAYADALESGDAAAAAEARLELDQALLTLEREITASADVFEGLDRGLGAEGETPISRFTHVERRLAEVDESDPDAARQAAAVEEVLARLETDLATFKRLSPDVAVQPFIPNEQLASGVDIPLTTYYAPAVLIVLAQHLALTFGALSMVREANLGTTDLFRVGPTTTADVLLGKYLGYSVLAAGVTALLSVVLVTVFGVPMQGSWAWLAVIVAMVVVASLALGFVIAGFSSTDSQAVQFAMLTLLFTIFFSGFVLSLDRIAPAARGLAFLVPATAGISALQDIMFGGVAPRPVTLLALTALLAVAFVTAVWTLRLRLETRPAVSGLRLRRVG